ncbi:HD domain-containing protein [Phyllosticta citribraziliensis]|uniref:5'-deoxynucleotidase n=1 Tax=Phyllosticta citribraziliensis TaxID=989973 RepID=A0ABR1M3B6_9PEZI
MAPPDAPQTNNSPKPDSGLVSQQDVEGTWSPETVLSQLPSRPAADSASPLPFMHVLERLKTTKREGWRRFGINHGESISDHMYRMSILTMLAPATLSARLDIPRCTKMALVHDMAEALVGDITPVDPISKEEKSRRETATMDYLCTRLLGSVASTPASAVADIRAVWQEYEDNVTPEAQFVHDIDKMELLLQMMEYEKSQNGALDVGEFTWVATKITLPEINEWAEQLFEERRLFWKSVDKEPSWGG